MKNNEINMFSLYWKYIWHHKGSIFFAIVLSFFFGFGSLLFTWIILSVMFTWDYNRSLRELKDEERFNYLIKTIQQTSTPHYQNQTQNSNQPEIELPEELEQIIKDGEPWGEA